MLSSCMNSLLRNTKTTPTMLIVSNAAQLVDVNLCVKPTLTEVPLAYEMLHRATRRKMHLPVATATDLEQDYILQQYEKF